MGCEKSGNGMSLSNEYRFNPSLGDALLQSFHMCGVRPASLLQEHLSSARMAANLMLSAWSARGVNLWLVQLFTTPLVAGTTTYSVDPNIVVILDMYVTVGSGDAETDRIILPVSRTEYSSYANKEMQGFPSVAWFNRQLTAPEITLWPVPNGQQVDLKYYALYQSMDANLANGGNVQVPIYFMEAFVTGLAARLAVIWAPDRAQGLKALADEAYQIAASQNVEQSDFYVSPMLSSYFRP